MVLAIAFYLLLFRFSLFTVEITLLYTRCVFDDTSINTHFKLLWLYCMFNTFTTTSISNYAFATFNTTLPSSGDARL